MRIQKDTFVKTKQIKMKPLTAQSVKSYEKILKNIIDIKPLEIFLEIGVELCEMEPEGPYIHFLIEMMQEKYHSNNIDELNMRIKQIQDFYNDIITTYEMIQEADALVDAERLPIEELVMAMMAMQSPTETFLIVSEAVFNAVDTITDEYGFGYMLDEMDDDALLEFVREEVFADIEVLRESFLALWQMRQRLLSDEDIDDDQLFSMTMLLIVFLSTLNSVRQARVEMLLQQEMEVTQKIGRNDPCPCGSGKKYKKCCGMS